LLWDLNSNKTNKMQTKYKRKITMSEWRLMFLMQWAFERGKKNIKENVFRLHRNKKIGRIK